MFTEKHTGEWNQHKLDKFEKLNQQKGSKELSKAKKNGELTLSQIVCRGVVCEFRLWTDCPVYTVYSVNLSNRFMGILLAAVCSEGSFCESS